MVVDFLVAQTGLCPEHAHLVIGEQPVVEGRHPEDHVAVRVPPVEMHIRSHILGRAFGEPGRDHGEGDGIGDEHVGVAGEYIVATAFALVSEHVQIHGGQPAGAFAGGLQRDDVCELVGDHVLQPVCGAAQFVVKTGGPDLYRIVVVVGCAVGIVLGVLDDQADLFVRLEAIEAGYRTVDRFRCVGRPPGARCQPLVVIDFEVLCLQDLPDQFRMVGVKRLRTGGRHREQQNQ